MRGRAGSARRRSAGRRKPVRRAHAPRTPGGVHEAVPDAGLRAAEIAALRTGGQEAGGASAPHTRDAGQTTGGGRRRPARAGPDSAWTASLGVDRMVGKDASVRFRRRGARSARRGTAGSRRGARPPGPAARPGGGRERHHAAARRAGRERLRPSADRRGGRSGRERVMVRLLSAVRASRPGPGEGRRQGLRRVDGGNQHGVVNGSFPDGRETGTAPRRLCGTVPSILRKPAPRRRALPELGPRLAGRPCPWRAFPPFDLRPCPIPGGAFFSPRRVAADPAPLRPATPHRCEASAAARGSGTVARSRRLPSARSSPICRSRWRMPLASSVPPPDPRST